MAPVLYMVKDGMKEALENFVKNGGILITTFMSGIVGQSDNVYLGGYPGPLREMAGVWVEEIDALAPEQKNKAKFADGSTAACGLLCDLMHLEGAKALASYEEDFYAGMPAASKNTYGKGTTYYIATQFEEEGLAKIWIRQSRRPEFHPLSQKKPDLKLSHASVIPRDSILS